MKKLTLVLTIALLAATATASFDTFVIRDGASGSPVIQTNNTYVPGATEFITNESGMKAGWGSNDINGYTIGDITQLAITRYDDFSEYASGSGPAVAPYFNIWVTDGLGNYATIANQPSQAIFQPLFENNGDGSYSYDLSYADLAGQNIQVYETVNGGHNSTTTWVHNMFGNNQLTFADVASLVIAAPPVSNQTLANGVGAGAADVLGTDVAYGFNWVFGDTLSNYVTGDTGYVVANPIAAAVPEPATLALLGLGGLLMRRKK